MNGRFGNRIYLSRETPWCLVCLLLEYQIRSDFSLLLTESDNLGQFRVKSVDDFDGEITSLQI